MIENIILGILDWIHWTIFFIGCLTIVCAIIVWHLTKLPKEEEVYHREMERRANEVSNDM